MNQGLATQFNEQRSKSLKEGGPPREFDSLSEAYRTVLDCIVPYCTAKWQMSLTLSCHDRTLYGGKLRAVNNELV